MAKYSCYRHMLIFCFKYSIYQIFTYNIYALNRFFYSTIFVKADSTSNEISIMTTILIDTNLIPLAMLSILIEKNVRFEILWP